MFESEGLGEVNFCDDCKSVIEKFLTICLPVSTTPIVRVGKIKTECCGNPIVSSKKYEKCCGEMKNGSCDFTVIQKMKVEIPIDFTASTKIDDLYVDCEFRHDKDEDEDKNDKDCKDDKFNLFTK